MFDTDIMKTSKMSDAHVRQIAAKGEKILLKYGYGNEAVDKPVSAHLTTRVPAENEEHTGKPAEAALSREPPRQNHRYKLRPRNASGYTWTQTRAHVPLTAPNPHPGPARVPVAAAMSRPIPGRVPVSAPKSRPRVTRNPSQAGPTLPGGDSRVNDTGVPVAIGTWFEVENQLRAMQGKRPVSFRFAPPDTMDDVGCRMYVISLLHVTVPLLTCIHRYCYLEDVQAGVSQSVGRNTYQQMLSFNRYLTRQKNRLLADVRSTAPIGNQLTQLAEHQLGMRGQALSQPAPATFAAIVRESTRSALTEKRQITLTNLSLDANAADIEALFADFVVETIVVAFDSVTALPHRASYSRHDHTPRCSGSCPKPFWEVHPG